jgi:hypothetical protein
MAKKEEKKLSFAGRSLESREGKMDGLLEKGSTTEELEAFVLKGWGKQWSERIVKDYMKNLMKTGAIKLETKIILNGTDKKLKAV